jgi:hypothetical protein
MFDFMNYKWDSAETARGLRAGADAMTLRYTTMHAFLGCRRGRDRRGKRGHGKRSYRLNTIHY